MGASLVYICTICCSYPVCGSISGFCVLVAEEKLDVKVLVVRVLDTLWLSSVDCNVVSVLVESVVLTVGKGMIVVRFEAPVATN